MKLRESVSLTVFLRRGLRAACVGVLCFGPAIAHGQPLPEPDKARSLFLEARALIAEGMYPPACEKFEESLAIEEGIGTEYNLADCWEHLGRTASAHALFSKVARTARELGQDERAQVAQRRADALKPRVSRLAIRVEQPIRGMVIWRDGAPIEQRRRGVPVAVDPGVHRISILAPGKKPWYYDVRVPDGGQLVVVKVPALRAARAARASERVEGGGRKASSAAKPSPARPRAPAPHSPPAAPPGHHLSPAAWALGGVGVLGVAAGVFFAVRFDERNAAARGICPRQVGCTRDEIDRHASLVDDAKSSRLGSYIGFGAAAAALTGTAALYLTSGGAAQSDDARVGLHLSPQGGWNAALSGHF